MISDKSFDIGFNPSRLFVSDIPIKSKAYCRVFIDVIGEGSWSIIEDNLYDVINDTIVFIEAPIGKLLAIQVATTPSEFTQTPTENTMVLSIKNEIKAVANNVDSILEIGEFVDSIDNVADNITNVNKVGTDILNVNKVADSILNVNRVGTDIDDVNNVSTNITNVNKVGTDILNVNKVGTDILNVNIVATNIDDVNTVVDNLEDIQNAEENALSALNSKNIAEKWASEDRNIEVVDGEYSAKHWAEVAEETVTIGIIDDITPSNTKTYSSNKINELLKLTLPAGTVITFASSTAPAGYLKANGALISRTAYADLFAIIGTTFGAGNGSTTFALPDLRAYFPRGWDDGRGIDTGRVFGSNQDEAFKSHDHTGTYSGSTGGYTYVAGFSSGSKLMAHGIWSAVGNFTSSVVSAGGIETRPKNIALLYCIKY